MPTFLSLFVRQRTFLWWGPAAAVSPIIARVPSPAASPIPFGPAPLRSAPLRFGPWPPAPFATLWSGPSLRSFAAWAPSRAPWALLGGLPGSAFGGVLCLLCSFRLSSGLRVCASPGPSWGLSSPRCSSGSPSGFAPPRLLRLALRPASSVALAAAWWASGPVLAVLPAVAVASGGRWACACRSSSLLHSAEPLDHPKHECQPRAQGDPGLKY